MPRARPEDWSEWEDYVYDVPTIEVDWTSPEPLILYGPDGETVILSSTPPVGFARAIPPTRNT